MEKVAALIEGEAGKVAMEVEQDALKLFPALEDQIASIAGGLMERTFEGMLNMIRAEFPSTVILAPPKAVAAAIKK